MSQITTAPARPIKKPAQKPCSNLSSFYRLLREHRNDLEGRWTKESGMSKEDLRFLLGKQGEEVICPLVFLWLVLSGEMECFGTAAKKLGLSADHQGEIVVAADDIQDFYNRAIQQWLLWATGLSEEQPATAK